jgi:triosephosphate isomerase
MKKKLIAGNWKMNLTLKSSRVLAQEIAGSITKKDLSTTDVLICPTFIALPACSKILADSDISLGAQNMSDKDDGAFTGEISASMLTAVGCEYVIIGHSERRKYFGETNHVVNSKVAKALSTDLKPIMCVGETLQEREDDIFEAIVEKQISEGLAGITDEQMTNVTIAYEPVWAIGTGVNATPKQASDMHKFIRKLVSEKYGTATGDNIRILYGGSVNAKNAREILHAGGIDGALVGGASLKVDDFHAIISAASGK